MIALKALFLCFLVSKVCCFTVNFKFTLGGIIYYGHADSEVGSEGSQWLKITSVNEVNAGEGSSDGSKVETTKLVEVYNSFENAKTLAYTAISKSLNANLDFTIDDVTWQDVYIIQVEPTQDATSLRFSYVLHQTFFCSFTLGNYKYSNVTAESIIGRTNRPWLKIIKIGAIDDESKRLRHHETDTSTSTLASRIGNKFVDFKLSVEGTHEITYIRVISPKTFQEGSTTTVVLSYEIISFWNYTFVLGGVTYYGVAEEVSATLKTLQIRYAYTGEIANKRIDILNLVNCYETSNGILTDVNVAITDTQYWGLNPDKIDWIPVAVVDVIPANGTLQFSFQM